MACRKRRRLREGTTDWTSLPGELVQLIADRLSAVEDFVALTSVCRTFRSSTKKDLWRPLEVSRPPWLLLGYGDEGSANEKSSAVSMYTKKNHCLNLPELHGRHCFGTPYGWIVTLGLDLQVDLFNPLIRRRITLPTPPNSLQISERMEDLLGHTRFSFFNRAILIKRPPSSHSSSSTFDDEFVVVAVSVFHDLCVMRPQQNTWETINLRNRIHMIWDIAYYNGQIYVLGPYGSILICSNLDGPGSLIVGEYIPCDIKIMPDAITWHLYLLESLGDLLLVFRFALAYRPFAFNVFKFNHQTKIWIEVADLGERSLFVGDCQAISLSLPESFNLRSNCIYFIRDTPLSIITKETEWNRGVFDLKRRTNQRLLKGSGSLSVFSAKTWFIPTLS